MRVAWTHVLCSSTKRAFLGEPKPSNFIGSSLVVPNLDTASVPSGEGVKGTSFTIPHSYAPVDTGPLPPVTRSDANCDPSVAASRGNGLAPGASPSVHPGAEGTMPRPVRPMCRRMGSSTDLLTAWDPLRVHVRVTAQGCPRRRDAQLPPTCPPPNTFGAFVAQSNPIVLLHSAVAICPENVAFFQGECPRVEVTAGQS